MKLNLSMDKTTYLKGIAIILILLGHTNIIRYGGLIGVGLFLILSGYGIYESYLKNGLNNFFKKRITKVLIPYWIFNTIWLIIDYFIGNTYSIKNTVFSFIAYKNIIDITMWYIGYLLSWYIIFWIIFNFKNKKLRLILLLLSPILSLFLSYKGFFGTGGGAQFYILMFPLGVILCYLLKNHNDLIQKYFIPTLTILLFIFLYTYNNDFTTYLPYIKTVLLLLSTVLIFVLVMSSIKFDTNKYSLVMLYGKYSYFIYLIEGVFLNKYNILKNFIDNKYLYSIIFVILMLIISIPLNKLYDKLIKK